MAQARQTGENEQAQQGYGQGGRAEQAGGQYGGRQGGERGQYGGERSQGRPPAAINIAAVALRGLSEAYDMQVTATRLALQTQARAAVAFGWPDYSELFRIGDGRAKRSFAIGTEQLLHTAQQAGQTFSEVQREVGKLMECNAESLAESWQQGLEEFGIQAEESLEQMRELARQQVEQAMQAAESLGDATRQAVRESGEQFRESVRQGAETARQGAERGREMISEGAETVRKEGERVAGAARGEEEGEERATRRGRAA